MKNNNHVTIDTARKLKKLGYSENCCCYFINHKDPLIIHNAFPSDWNSTRCSDRIVSLPTCDEVIEWIERKNKDVFINIVSLPCTDNTKRHYASAYFYESYRRGEAICSETSKNKNVAKRKLLRKLITKLCNV